MNLTILKFWLIRLMMWISLIPFGYAMFHLMLGMLTPLELDTDFVSVIISLGIFIGLFFGKDILLDKWRNDFRVYDELQGKSKVEEPNWV